jgi:hypothetical protein
MRRLIRSLAIAPIVSLLLFGLRPQAHASPPGPPTKLRICLGSEDVNVDGGQYTSPNTPSNLSTDLSGWEAALHAEFQGPSPDGRGQVQYTLIDEKTNLDLCVAFGPIVDDGEDSPYVVSPGEDLQDGLPYAWVARSYNGLYYSLPTAPQAFIFTPAYPDSSPPPFESITTDLNGVVDDGFTSPQPGLVETTTPADPAPHFPAPAEATRQPPPGTQVPTGEPVPQAVSADSPSVATGPRPLWNWNMPTCKGIPPDPSIAASNVNVVLATNCNALVHARTSSNTSSTIQATFNYKDRFNLPDGWGYTDPQVVYDTEESRFIISIVACTQFCGTNGASNYIYFAISPGSDARASNWEVHHFGIGSQGFPDQPRVALTSTAVYFVANMFDSSGFFAEYLYAWDRSSHRLTTLSLVNPKVCSNCVAEKAFGTQPAVVSTGSDSVLYMVDTYFVDMINVWSVRCCFGGSDPSVQDVHVASHPVQLSYSFSPDPYGRCREKVYAENISVDEYEGTELMPHASLVLDHIFATNMQAIADSSGRQYDGLGVYDVYFKQTWKLAAFWHFYDPTNTNTSNQQYSRCMFDATVVTNDDGPSDGAPDQTLVWAYTSIADYPSMEWRQRIDGQGWYAYLPWYIAGSGPINDCTASDQPPCSYGDFAGAAVDSDNATNLDYMWVYSEYGNNSKWGGTYASMMTNR